MKSGIFFLTPFIVEGVEAVLRMSDRAVNVVQEYNTYKDEHFPGIGTIQDMYNDLPKDQRKAFLNAMPELSEYWDWNREYKDAHPDVTRWLEDRTDYYNEVTCYNSYAEMSESTQKQLEYNKATGKEMSDTAKFELNRLYQKHSDPLYTTYADYIKMLQNYE